MMSYRELTSSLFYLRIKLGETMAIIRYMPIYSSFLNRFSNRRLIRGLGVLAVAVLLSCCTPLCQACDPIVFSDFSLARIHTEFIEKLEKVETDMERLGTTLHESSLMAIDGAFVNLLVDWMAAYTKYDHWITANVDGRRKIGSSIEALHWLESMRSIGQAVRDMNWLLDGDNYEELGQRLTEVRSLFDPLLVQAQKSLGLDPDGTSPPEESGLEE